MAESLQVIARCTRCLLFDLEATGLSTDRDHIIGMAFAFAVHGSDGWSVVSTFNTLVNPGVRISKRIEQLTGITNDAVAGAPGFSAAWACLRSWLDDFSGGGPVLLVGHNAHNYDVPMLSRHVDDEGGKLAFWTFLSDRHIVACLDTLRVARSWRRVFPYARPSTARGPPSNSLGALYMGTIGKPLDGAHDALADTLAVYRVFFSDDEAYRSMLSLDLRALSTCLKVFLFDPQSRVCMACGAIFSAYFGERHTGCAGYASAESSLSIHARPYHSSVASVSASSSSVRGSAHDMPAVSGATSSSSVRMSLAPARRSVPCERRARLLCGEEDDEAVVAPREQCRQPDGTGSGSTSVVRAESTHDRGVSYRHNAPPAGERPVRSTRFLALEKRLAAGGVRRSSCPPTTPG